MLKVWVEEHWKTGSSCLTGQDLVLQYPVSTTLMTSKYSYELSRCSSVTAVVLPLGSTGFARYWNFQLSVKNNSGLFCFCITSLGVWSRKLGSLTQPIWYITKKTNRYLVALVFLGFDRLVGFNFELPLAFKDIFLLSDWSL